MQNRITENLDYGIPGEFASTTPRVVSPVVLTADATFGGLLGVKDGAYGKMGTTYTAYAGVCASPHQHVNMGSAGDALAPTMVANAGATVACVTKGDIFVTATASMTAADKAAFKKLTVAAGTKVYYTSAGAITTVATSNTLLGTVVIARDLADVEDDDITITSGTGTAALTLAVRLA